MGRKKPVDLFFLCPSARPKRSTPAPGAPRPPASARKGGGLIPYFPAGGTFLRPCPGGEPRFWPPPWPAPGKKSFLATAVLCSKTFARKKGERVPSLMIPWRPGPNWVGGTSGNSPCSGVRPRPSFGASSFRSGFPATTRPTGRKNGGNGPWGSLPPRPARRSPPPAELHGAGHARKCCPPARTWPPPLVPVPLFTSPLPFSPRLNEKGSRASVSVAQCPFFPKTSATAGPRDLHPFLARPRPGPRSEVFACPSPQGRKLVPYLPGRAVVNERTYPGPSRS